MLQGENADTASMKLGNTFYDGQAKAGALRFSAGILAAVIAVKEMCRILRRDSPSVVGNGDLEHGIRNGGQYCDFGVFISMDKSIDDQVTEGSC